MKSEKSNRFSMKGTIRFCKGFLRKSSVVIPTGGAKIVIVHGAHLPLRLEFREYH